MTISAYLRLKRQLGNRKIVIKKSSTDKRPELTETTKKQVHSDVLNTLEKFRNRATQAIKSVTQQITQKITMPPDLFINTQRIQITPD